MTTIAWDGTTLAVDSQLTGPNGVEPAKKLFVSARWAYAGCGNWSDVILIAEWAKRGMPRDDLPTIDREGPFGIVVNRETRKAFLLDGTGLALVPRVGKCAEGTGAAFAISAMALGHDAAEAVRFAMRFDRQTGGRIRRVAV